MAFNYNLLYRNISPFCEPLSFDLPQEFYAVFLTNFLLYLYNFLLSFATIDYHTFYIALHLYTNFFFVFLYGFSLLFAANRFPCILQILHCFSVRIFFAYFIRISSLFLQQIRLARLFCLYNLTKRSSYTLLHAVPLKQWFWLYFFEFLDAKPILQCLWLSSFSRLVLSLKTFLLLPPSTVLCIFFKC